MAKYVVVVESPYTRNTEIFAHYQGKVTLDNIDEFTGADKINEFTSAYNGSGEEWIRQQHDLYLGIYDWDSDDVDGLLKHVAKRKGYNPVILNAYLVH